jgi:serine/threonine protein kinase
MIGQVIARYRILAELGAGGMGVVYRAEDLTLHREVGLKVLPATASSSAVERFLREARAAASLNHPNICTVYDAGEHEGRPYIAMELLKGQSLRTLLMNQRLPVSDVLDMGTQIADGIAAAHAKGIIHRDIKPANIWVTEDRLVKVLDFGLVKLMPELGGNDPAAAETALEERVQLTEHAAVVGTIAYMSPEQARGEVLDTRTDLFSLGVVLYEMYTGRQPFRGTTSAVVFNAILSHQPPPFTETATARAAALERIVSKALLKDRGLRFQHASEIASELRIARRRLDIDTATVVPPAPPDEHKHDTSQLDRLVGPLDIPEVLRGYLRRFPDADVQHRRLRHYVWPTIGVEDPITGRELLVTQAEQFVRTTLVSDPEAFVLLLGDYGSGKTSFLQMLGRELATEVLMGTPGVPFPIYLSLGFARHAPDLLTAICTHLARHGVPLSPVELGDFIARQHHVVFLLDGFDEMAGWVDYGAIPDILEKIRRLQSVSGVRLVLSGRSSFFRSDVEVGILGASHVARLRPFDDKNILHYVSLRDPALVAQAATLLDRHLGLREICRNPIHLMLFTTWLETDSKARQSRSTQVSAAEHASDADLSEFSVAGLYQRFFTKTLQDNFGTLTKWPLDQRWAFVRRVAWRWFNNDIVEWPFGEFSKQIKAEFPELSADEIDRYTVQLLNCTFFARSGDRYRFLHRSYLEYLVSEGLAEGLLAGDLTMWESETPLYTDIHEMTYQILKSRGLERLDLDWVKQTGNYVAHVKVLTVAWRHSPPEIEAHIREQILGNPHDVVRLMGSMGMALYAPTQENVDNIVAAFTAETNSVVRALKQRVASHWHTVVQSAELKKALQPVVDTQIDLRTEDAQRATLQVNYSKPEQVLLAFRRAMVQGDRLWPAAAGAILALGAVRHSSSFAYIQRVASAARHPEIRAAYKLVQPFTRLPDLSRV